MNPTELAPKLQAAERWFGYGRWSAPYWFVGKEPGGADEQEQYASWLRLGGGELIDCADQDRDCARDGKMQWHAPGSNPPLQRTWRALIAMLLAYQDAAEYDEAAVRRYQNDRWGRSNGETAVIELSGTSAPSLAHAQDARLVSVDSRIATLRARIAEHRPEFVVLYGLSGSPTGVSYLEYWSKIAGAPLTVGEPQAIEKTIFVAQPHPTAHGTTNHQWLELGRELRRLHESVAT